MFSMPLGLMEVAQKLLEAREGERVERGPWEVDMVGD